MEAVSAEAGALARVFGALGSAALAQRGMCKALMRPGHRLVVGQATVRATMSAY